MLDQGGIVRVTLCPSCLNATTCVERVLRGYDALFCDLFEDSGSLNMKDCYHVKVSGPLSVPHGERTIRKPRKVVKGLCENCVKRDICALPRPKTGVWHCEEFEEIP